MWASHVYFPNLSKRAWDNSLSLITAINQFQIDALKWNKESFGNIFICKKRILNRLQGIQNSVNYPHISFLLQLEQSLIQDFNYTLNL